MSLLSEYTHNYSENHSVLVHSALNFSEKFLILDRDGVLIEDVHHIVNPSSVSLLPNCADLIKSALDLDYSVAIVTNQSFLARGLAPFKAYLDVTEKMFEYLGYKSLPHVVLASFWHPSFSRLSSFSEWRKPDVGMFNYLIKHFGCNTESSIMVGDKLTDLQPAAHLNVANLVHIHTQSHPTELIKVKDWATRNGYYVQSLESLPQSVHNLLNFC